MTRYQCIKEILDSFDYYEERNFLRLGSGKYLRKELLGHSFVQVSENLTAAASSPMATWRDEEKLQREAFARMFRAYVFKSVREGRNAGLDYPTIAYALCKKLCDASASVAKTQEYVRRLSSMGGNPRNGSDSESRDSAWARQRGMARFSMKAYAHLLSVREDFGRVYTMESPRDIPIRRKLAFLRAERDRRREPRSELVRLKEIYDDSVRAADMGSSYKVDARAKFKSASKSKLLP